MTIADNLAAIRAALPATVTLVAVSKTRPASIVAEALAAGQLDFGENYAQELRDKADQIGPGPRWHFIGGLQRNKVKYVVGRAMLIHDVDTIELAEEIGKRSGNTPTAILVGVNMGEAQKSGVPAARTLEFARAVLRVPGVSLRGLMTIPPATEDPADAAPYFAELAALAAAGRADGLPLHELSMGMSHDWRIAVAHGATLVRVGTAIFGSRRPVSET
ncbi:MAG: YggS family pyridoxal phosphate-dependent enzyme [Myxococcales bacterium]|nr:YggS family pyridoxal phosphate-dependent enzyme [Myxococcales bacterium]